MRIGVDEAAGIYGKILTKIQQREALPGSLTIVPLSVFECFVCLEDVIQHAIPNRQVVCTLGEDTFQIVRDIINAECSITDTFCEVYTQCLHDESAQLLDQLIQINGAASIAVT